MVTEALDMELEPYLFFDGDCEQALALYAEVFGGEVTALQRFEGSPMEAQIPAAHRKNVMHANFRSPTLRFMASDGMPGTPRPSGSRIALSLGTRNVQEAERVFNRLAEGGEISMPLQDTFWGSRFGMVVDKYGVEWMINCEKVGST